MTAIKNSITIWVKSNFAVAKLTFNYDFKLSIVTIAPMYFEVSQP